MTPRPIPLPAPFESIRILSQGAQGVIHHAKSPAGEVAFRLLGAAHQAAQWNELGVLAELHHPGLAALVDYGKDEATGKTWIARTWIEGEGLAAWAKRQDPREVGRLLADLTAPLQYLHDRGFIHGDLKPDNVLVDQAGAPHLTDFGLSHRRGTSGSAGGTLFFVAPERLAGGDAGPAADLFALGVTLHSLLLSPTVSAAEFYGSFPRLDFFAATGTSLSQLPEWSRELVASLLEREPSRRPSSAYSVGATLRARLGLPPEKQANDLRRRVVRWSPLAGREDWLASLQLTAGSTGSFELPPGESPSEFAHALRLWLSQRGLSAKILEPNPRLALHNLDEQAQTELAQSGNGLLIVPLQSTDRDGRRQFEFLERYASQHREQSSAQNPGLIAVHCGPYAGEHAARNLWKVPELDRPTLTALLREEIGGEVDAIAGELFKASKGACEVARRQIQRGFACGDFIEGPEGPCLRQGANPANWNAALEFSELSPRPSREELELLAALEVCGGSATLETLGRLLIADTRSMREAIDGALAHGLVRREAEERGDRIALAQSTSHLVAERVSRERWQALHRSRAEALELDEASSLQIALARYASDPTAERFTQALALLQGLVEAWRPELALEFAEAMEAHATRFEPLHVPRARAEVAIAWARIGELDTSTAMLAELEAQGTDSPETLATIERSRGVIAHERHDLVAAAAHLQRARELNPRDGGESLFRQALLAFERRAEAELARLHELSEREAKSPPSVSVWNIRALVGLSRCRRGEQADGLRMLEDQLEQALAAGDEAREAKSRLNLATVIRRSSHSAEAIAHLQRAVEIHLNGNHLPGLAQARAMLGGTLRAEGRLLEAGEELRAAYELRERLGDESGAMAARGMLGLVLADGGRLRGALDELTASADFLRAAQRSADASLLEARALEMDSRLRSHPPKHHGKNDPDPDPRILTSFARAEILWGRLPNAREYAQRAFDLASKLGLGPACIEAQFLLQAMDSDQVQLPALDGATPRLRAEGQVWSQIHLSADRFVPADALQLAHAVAFKGYFDLASRLAIAVHRRSEDEPDRQAAMQLARKWLEEVERGLTPEEVSRAHLTLLGLPDPRPQEIANFQNASANRGVIDLDIISLLDINHRLVEQDDLPSLLAEIVESALAVTRGERGFLVLERDGEIEFDTARTSSRGDIPDPELEVSSSVLRRVFDSCATVRLSNAGEDPVLGGAPSVEQLDLRSILVTPFTVDEELRGAIYVDHRLRQGAFSDRAEQLLELLATQAALAIRQVRRLDEIRSLNGELKNRVRDREQQLARAREALAQVGGHLPVPELIGSSQVMRNVCANILRAAPAALPVLVCGASGTGKELAARALHANSKRSEGPFIAENCAALPASLIESELFGYRKGAFTGADRDRAGIFERADTGTLFLDEIGELPMELQAKLLRVLETGELRRVGDTKLIRTDFRLIAATNRDLQSEVIADQFRSDLMYRLDGLRIDMPSLSDHETDIPELVQHFLEGEREESGLQRKVSQATMAALCRRDWPGNVRELANEVKRLCVLSEGDLDDPTLIRPPALRAASHGVTLQARGGVIPFVELERLAIENALRATGNDKRKAAELLGISRAKLYQRLKEWSQENGDGAPVT